MSRDLFAELSRRDAELRKLATLLTNTASSIAALVNGPTNPTPTTSGPAPIYQRGPRTTSTQKRDLLRRVFGDKPFTCAQVTDAIKNGAIPAPLGRARQNRYSYYIARLLDSGHVRVASKGTPRSSSNPPTYVLTTKK